MTFREALEREISSQGISVAEVAEKSNVSKGTIYNILNGTTEEARIRAATRRAIAKGCGRNVEALPNGGFVFVDPRSSSGVAEQRIDGVRINLVPFCHFRSNQHCAEPFDWLHRQEEDGKLQGLNVVDRVFQQREDFLELVVQNDSDVDLTGFEFSMRVVYDDGVAGELHVEVSAFLRPEEIHRRTLFLSAGSAFHLQLKDWICKDEEGQNLRISQVPDYRYKGDMT